MLLLPVIDTVSLLAASFVFHPTSPYSIRPFCYNHYGDLPDSSRAEDGNINCMDDTLAAVPMADVAGDETLSKMRSVGMGNGTTPVVTIGITPTGEQSFEKERRIGLRRCGFDLVLVIAS